MKQPGQKWRHRVDLGSGVGLWGQFLAGVLCGTLRETAMAWLKEERFDGKC